MFVKKLLASIIHDALILPTFGDGQWTIREFEQK